MASLRTPDQINLAEYAITPDAEDFGDYTGPCDLNAAELLHVLQYIKGKDPKDIYAIGTLYALM
jgi:hypothetical protein